MDKKYVFIGILSAFVVLTGIGLMLLNQGVSSDTKLLQFMANSPLADCCDVDGNNSTNLSQNMNTLSSGVKTVRHGYLPSNGDALIFVAKEEGFWTEEGLNVELYQFTKGPEP